MEICRQEFTWTDFLGGSSLVPVYYYYYYYHRRHKTTHSFIILIYFLHFHAIVKHILSMSKDRTLSLSLINQYL